MSESILDQAATPIAGDAAMETVRGPETDPTDTASVYCVQRNISSGALFLVHTREREGKDASVKRIPLRQVGRASALGLLD